MYYYRVCVMIFAFPLHFDLPMLYVSKIYNLFFFSSINTHPFNPSSVVVLASFRCMYRIINDIITYTSSSNSFLSDTMVPFVLYHLFRLCYYYFLYKTFFSIGNTPNVLLLPFESALSIVFFSRIVESLLQ